MLLIVSGSILRPEIPGLSIEGESINVFSWGQGQRINESGNAAVTHFAV